MNSQKLDDNRLYESTTVIPKSDDTWYRESTIRREFNFLSRQRTTNVEAVLWNKKNNQMSVGVTTTIDNFRDIEGEGEIERAHAELRRLGGKPPPIDEVLGRLKKAPALKI